MSTLSQPTIWLREGAPDAAAAEPAESERLAASALLLGAALLLEPAPARPWLAWGLLGTAPIPPSMASVFTAQ